MHLHVLPLLQVIPTGKISTYGDMARFLGVPKNSRQIGYILGHNDYPDVFPCYKVVATNGSIGGYSASKGILTKIGLLKKDGIGMSEKTVENFGERRWEPEWHSYFVALPLDGENKRRFREVYEEVSKAVPDGIVSFQKPETPHVTLHFFGNLSFSELAEIVVRLRKWEKSLKKMPPIKLRFQKLDYFREKGEVRVGFFGMADGDKALTEFQLGIMELLGVENTRSYRPHITLFRVMDTARFEQYKERIERVANNMEFTLNFQTIRLSGAADTVHQIPLADFGKVG